MAADGANGRNGIEEPSERAGQRSDGQGDAKFHRKKHRVGGRNAMIGKQRDDGDLTVNKTAASATGNAKP